MKMTKFLLLMFPLFIVGCSAIANTADSIGSHLPTIGEPCHHWQCITSSGQKKSDEIKQIEEAAPEKKDAK